jgi:hypothetical protein
LIPTSSPEDDADIVFLEIQRDPVEAPGELHHFAGHGPVQTIDLRNPIPDLQDGSHLGRLHGAVKALDLALEDLGNFFSLHLHSTDSFGGTA